jgi:methylated-DNA-protein-cysteine methyltransferase-like protein
MELFKQVYKAVKKIPPGKVVSYGQIGMLVGTRDFRRVGQALHANRDPQTPCHRVVFADGSLAPGYVFGGKGEQKKRLVAEGVMFVGEKVDMLKSRHSIRK